MDFFDAQDQARRQTGRLIGLLALAVLGLIAAAAVVVALGVALMNGGRTEAELLSRALDPWLLGSVALGVLAVVGLGSLLRHLQLRRGGSAVAEALGGRLLNVNTRDADERRLLNVVEEMAIASGMPVPAVYVLEDAAINAFAAGYSPQDAAIGVTRGAIRALDRDELQGVVAHEFSHILHGDMRLNLRLVALLHGIVLIGLAGRMLLRGLVGGRRVGRSRRGGGHVAILGVGVALMVVGYAGTLSGNLIKAAVSRQREFLADASAVQYTRNPAGIARALKRLAAHAQGSELRAAQAAEFSHLYFGRGVAGLRGLTATHPPLEERIRRLDPGWDGSLPAPRRSEPSDGAPAPADSEATPGAAGLAAAHPAPDPARGGAGAELLGNSIGRFGPEDLTRARQALAGLDPALLEAAHDPYAARALVYGLLMGVAPESRERQRRALVDQALPEVLGELDRLAEPLAGLSPGQRLPLIELVLPVLGQLSTAQYARFRHCLERLMAEESEPGALQWALHRLVRVGIEGEAGPGRHRRRLEQLEGPAALLLSSLARAGDGDAAQAREAFTAAAGALPLALGYVAPAASCAELDWAMRQLQSLVDEDRIRLLTAMARCVSDDGRIAAAEAELLRAVAWSLGCPLPVTATQVAATDHFPAGVSNGQGH
ncbi:M48 family metallopeptidase [Halomonas campisalis]|uniref:M48 family metallopeptidase n=1 Tax=Billgrantia campisalis TaxID=74661 RepID=A0ABS9PAD0_9GAMM|nr:M48 family metallopeptidase [Halomonas campisalis]MCG6658707.1 M48 family metallopeptidase [Halomonas campisalis]MDR5864028.1 M48 family metallopeptidase [Halomonas campisalis]